MSIHIKFEYGAALDYSGGARQSEFAMALFSFVIFFLTQERVFESRISI